MVRIKDVAEAVGVSTATVSNVINGKEQRVSKEVREKIQTALDEMGYVRNRSAMMLAQTSSNMIGLVIPCKPGVKIVLEDPYYSAFLGNLEYEIREHDCYMYLIAQQTEEEIIRQAKEEAERLLQESNARIENTIRTIKAVSYTHLTLPTTSRV